MGFLYQLLLTAVGVLPWQVLGRVPDAVICSLRLEVRSEPKAAAKARAAGRGRSCTRPDVAPGARVKRHVDLLGLMSSSKKAKRRV